MAERKKYLLRINPKLWDELEAWAQSDFRSVNAQIEFILNQAVRKRKRISEGAGGSVEEES